MENYTLIVVKTSRTIGTLFFLIAVCIGGALAQPDEQSVARITELITARPDSDNLYIQRGNIYLYLNRLAEAPADAEKAFELNPQNTDAFLLRGKIKSQRQDTDGAITDISRAIKASPTGYPLAYLMRGELYEKKGDLPRAYADYKKLDELTDNPKAAQGIARLESKMKAAGIDPSAPIPFEMKGENKEAWAAFHAADKYIKKLEWQAAINEYGKAIALDPEFAAAYANRARLYGNQSEFDKAIADYAEAIRLKPDYADAFAARGGLYYIFNKPDLALADFTEAIRLVPNFSDAYLNRGRVYSKLNQNGKAVADWEQFLQLAPNSSNADLVRSYLANLRQSTSSAFAANPAASVQTNTTRSNLANKLEYYIKPVRELGKEIDALAAELKTNTATPARAKEIFDRIEQNSLKILSAKTEALKALDTEPDSADKREFQKLLSEDLAAMRNNLEAVAEERYFELEDKYEANVELLRPAIAAFKNAQTNDDRRKTLMEVARVSRENEAIAQKVIAQYLKYAKDKTIWGKLLVENENNLKYVEDMKLKYRIEF